MNIFNITEVLTELNDTYGTGRLLTVTITLVLQGWEELYGYCTIEPYQCVPIQRKFSIVKGKLTFLGYKRKLKG